MTEPNIIVAPMFLLVNTDLSYPNVKTTPGGNESEARCDKSLGVSDGPLNFHKEPTSNRDILFHIVKFSHNRFQTCFSYLLHHN